MEGFTELVMNGDDTGFFSREQWGVRVDYGDGRARYHIRSDEEAALRYLAYLQAIAAKQDWNITGIAVVKRTITTRIDEWEAA